MSVLGKPGSESGSRVLTKRSQYEASPGGTLSLYHVLFTEPGSGNPGEEDVPVPSPSEVALHPVLSATRAFPGLGAGDSGEIEPVRGFSVPFILSLFGSAGWRGRLGAGVCPPPAAAAEESAAVSSLTRSEQQRP